MYEKFYGTIGDAMIAGADIEISNRLTIQRRPVCSRPERARRSSAAEAQSAQGALKTARSAHEDRGHRQK
jgi:hypothetical protein